MVASDCNSGSVIHETPVLVIIFWSDQTVQQTRQEAQFQSPARQKCFKVVIFSKIFAIQQSQEDFWVNFQQWSFAQVRICNQQWDLKHWAPETAIFETSKHLRRYLDHQTALEKRYDMFFLYWDSNPLKFTAKTLRAHDWVWQTS